jgi:hypothetical protein
MRIILIVMQWRYNQIWNGGGDANGIANVYESIYIPSFAD